MLTKALEAITNVGEIEFHIDEESDEDDEDDDEEEILYDEEEMAREEIEKEEIGGEEVAKKDIHEEVREDQSAREERNAPQGGDVTEVQSEKVQPAEEGENLSYSTAKRDIFTNSSKLFETEISANHSPSTHALLSELPSVSSQGERTKENQEIPKEENQDRTPANKQRSTAEKKNEEKSSGKQKESKQGDTEEQYRERKEEEAEHEDETRDTITLLGIHFQFISISNINRTGKPLNHNCRCCCPRNGCDFCRFCCQVSISDTPRTNTTTSLPRTRSERSGRRSGTTRDSNPCFEVKFSAPDNDTISRYRDIR